MAFIIRPFAMRGLLSTIICESFLSTKYDFDICGWLLWVLEWNKLQPSLRNKVISNWALSLDLFIYCIALSEKKAFDTFLISNRNILVWLIWCNKWSQRLSRSALKTLIYQWDWLTDFPELHSSYLTIRLLIIGPGWAIKHFYIL